MTSLPLKGEAVNHISFMGVVYSAILCFFLSNIIFHLFIKNKDLFILTVFKNTLSISIFMGSACSKSNYSRRDSRKELVNGQNEIVDLDNTIGNSKYISLL